MPIIEYYKEIASLSPVMHFDYETIRYFLDKGETLAILLPGADLTYSELVWDCEACGFACAALHKFRIDSRSMATCGAATPGTGFLLDCSALIGISIGPPWEHIYCSRAQNMPDLPYEQHRECLLGTSPTNRIAFPGSTKPCLKQDTTGGKIWNTLNGNPSLKRDCNLSRKHWKRCRMSPKSIFLGYPVGMRKRKKPQIDLTYNHRGICGSLVGGVAIFGSEL